MARVQRTQPLRWGFSTGAALCAVALGAWREVADPEGINSEMADSQARHLQPVNVLFLDGRRRYIPLYDQRVQGMVTVQKDGGHDPDCTHKALLYGRIRRGQLQEATAQDYRVQVGQATLIIQAVEGIGLCARQGLDCEQGKWAINVGPRRMLAENLQEAGMQQGVWIFTCGVQHGEVLAKHSLNGHLGIEGGISILGTTGLVRPFSHDAYKATLQICVRSRRQSGGRSMVFCTGGRTKNGAQKMLAHLPPEAFACMADFIAFSLQSACAQGMEEIVVACMPGKLCKYAAGHANTHAHNTPQDLAFLQKALQVHMPHAKYKAVHEAVAASVTVREALLAVPKVMLLPLLRTLAEQALVALRRFLTAPAQVTLMVFDFQGQFLLQESRAVQEVLHTVEAVESLSLDMPAEEGVVSIITEAHIDAMYFLAKEEPCKS